MSMKRHSMYQFYITTENGLIVKANDVHDALNRGMPDYYGICSESSVLSVGQTVLSTLINGISIGKAGNDVNEVVTHYSISGNDYEQNILFYLYPVTRRLYLHALHTDAYSPFLRREDGRAEFQQDAFLKWIISAPKNCSSSHTNARNEFFEDFQSILPMLFLAWHKNQPDPDTLTEYPLDAHRTTNGAVAIWHDPGKPL